MGTAAYGGKGFKGRAGESGKRPIGAASFRQQYIQASCHLPCPPAISPLPSSIVLLPYTDNAVVPISVPHAASSLCVSAVYFCILYVSCPCSADPPSQPTILSLHLTCLSCPSMPSFKPLPQGWPSAMSIYAVYLNLCRPCVPSLY